VDGKALFGRKEGGGKDAKAVEEIQNEGEDP